MNLGALAGGVAKGISQGIKDDALNQEKDWKKKQEDRITKQQEDDDAMNAELKALYAQPAATSPTVADPATATTPTVETPATGRTSANPVSQGVMSRSLSAATPPAPTTDSAFDILNKAGKALDIKMKYNKATPLDVVRLMKIDQEMKKEGLRDAYLKIQNGDIQGGVDYFNQVGGNSGWHWKAPPVKQNVELPGGVNMPSVVGVMVNSNGVEKPVNTAQGLYGMMDFEKRLGSLQDINKQNSDNAYKTNALNETIRHDKATEKNNAARVAKYGAKGKTFTGANGNLWGFDENGKPYDMGVAAKGAKVTTLKDPTDGSITLVDDNGFTFKPRTPEQIRAEADNQAQAEADAKGKEWFSLQPSKDVVKKRADELYDTLLQQQEAARSAWQNRMSGDGKGSYPTLPGVTNQQPRQASNPPDRQNSNDPLGAAIAKVKGESPESIVNSGTPAHVQNLPSENKPGYIGDVSSESGPIPDNLLPKSGVDTSSRSIPDLANKIADKIVESSNGSDPVGLLKGAGADIKKIISALNLSRSDRDKLNAEINKRVKEKYRKSRSGGMAF